MEKVVVELTWSMSNRGYYIPILTRCDAMSDTKMTLASTNGLLQNYRRRDSVSADAFRELIASTIKGNNVLEGICPEDFKYVYGRDRLTARAYAFVCDSPCPQELEVFLYSSDFDTLFSWAFDSKGRYRQSLQVLPFVAYRLMQYGIVLICGMGTDDIYYDNLSD